MERISDTIGREEFSGVWDRVTKTVPDADAQSYTVTPLPIATSPTPTNGRPSVAVPFAQPSPVPLAPLSREAEALRLQEIMGRVAMSARECCAAARLCNGAARETLKCIERSCRATNRDLNTQYYILTAECCCPGSVVAPSCNVRETLRRVCENEALTREMCLHAAETTAFPSLEAAYARAARAAACRERAAERLLGRLGCS